jgi:hypothetical protein
MMCPAAVFLCESLLSHLCHPLQGALRECQGELQSHVKFVCSLRESLGGMTRMDVAQDGHWRNRVFADQSSSQSGAMVVHASAMADVASRIAHMQEALSHAQVCVVLTNI